MMLAKPWRLAVRLPSRHRGFFTEHPRRNWTERARTGWLTLWSPPVWLRRPVRAARVAVLGVGIYEFGKARGHIEALQDPDELLDGLVKSLVASQHLSSSGAKSGVYSRGSPALERVRSVGVRVLEASRSHVRTELQKLETELTVASRRPDMTHARELQVKIAELKAATKRLGGEWTWVVTNSEAVNAFVSPYCPRHLFIHQGLLSSLTPSDDELAFLISHEIAHVIHAHAENTLDRAAAAAQVMHLACYDSRSAGSMMAKLRSASDHNHSSWLDTHPPPLEREQSLERRAFALSLQGAHEDCTSVRGLLRGLYSRASRNPGGDAAGRPAQ